MHLNRNSEYFLGLPQVYKIKYCSKIKGAG